MRYMQIGSLQAILVFIAHFGILGLCASAQSPDKVLDKLKQKYPWGSIYLTYIPISDLTYLLNKQEKRDTISKLEGDNLVSTITSFLNAHRKPEMKQAIAFIEIDLNRVEAGFKRADDNDGVITKIPWDKAQVVQIAALCGKFLSGSLEAHEISMSIQSGDISLEEAWAAIGEIRDAPYIPYEKVVPLLEGMKTLITTRQHALSRLKESDKPLYEALIRFDKTFDASSSLEEKIASFEYPKSLYWRLGREDAISALVDDFVGSDCRHAHQQEVRQE
jgi:hypothetical protein